MRLNIATIVYPKMNLAKQFPSTRPVAQGWQASFLDLRVDRSPQVPREIILTHAQESGLDASKNEPGLRDEQWKFAPPVKGAVPPSCYWLAAKRKPSFF
jgi:hypothetical protein